MWQDLLTTQDSRAHSLGTGRFLTMTPENSMLLNVAYDVPATCRTAQDFVRGYS